MTCRRCAEAPAVADSGWCAECLRAEDERRAQLTTTTGRPSRATPSPAADAELVLPDGRRLCANEYCREPFEPRRSTGRYCKGACRVAVHRARLSRLSVTGG